MEVLEIKENISVANVQSIFDQVVSSNTKVIASTGQIELDLAALQMLIFINQSHNVKVEFKVKEESAALLKNAGFGILFNNHELTLN